MALSEDQVRFYRQTMEMTRQQVNDINGQIQEELAKARERIETLRTALDAAKQIYDGACKILGVENDLEKSEAASEEAEG